ncbi:unnamed protein product, partial [Prorocentrum cordatum]
MGWSVKVGLWFIECSGKRPWPLKPRDLQAIMEPEGYRLWSAEVWMTSSAIFVLVSLHSMKDIGARGQDKQGHNFGEKTLCEEDGIILPPVTAPPHVMGGVRARDKGDFDGKSPSDSGPYEFATRPCFGNGKQGDAAKDPLETWANSKKQTKEDRTVFRSSSDGHNQNISDIREKLVVQGKSIQQAFKSMEQEGLLERLDASLEAKLDEKLKALSSQTPAAGFSALVGLALAAGLQEAEKAAPVPVVGGILPEGAAAKAGAQVRVASSDCEAYRVRMFDLAAAAHFSDRAPSWFYHFRSLEKEARQSLGAKLASAREVMKLRMPHPVTSDIIDWSDRRHQSVSRARKIRYARADSLDKNAAFELPMLAPADFGTTAFRSRAQ